MKGEKLGWEVDDIYLLVCLLKPKLAVSFILYSCLTPEDSYVEYNLHLE